MIVCSSIEMGALIAARCARGNHYCEQLRVPSVPFLFGSAAINLKSDFAASYMYLAITLARLEDFDNACSAYDKVHSGGGGWGFCVTGRLHLAGARSTRSAHSARDVIGRHGSNAVGTVNEPRGQPSA